MPPIPVHGKGSKIMHCQRQIKVKLKTCLDIPGEVSGRQKCLILNLETMCVLESTSADTNMSLFLLLLILMTVSWVVHGRPNSRIPLEAHSVLSSFPGIYIFQRESGKDFSTHHCKRCSCCKSGTWESSSSWPCTEFFSHTAHTCIARVLNRTPNHFTATVALCSATLFWNVWFILWYAQRGILPATSSLTEGFRDASASASAGWNICDSCLNLWQISRLKRQHNGIIVIPSICSSTSEYLFMFSNRLIRFIV